MSLVHSGHQGTPGWRAHRTARVGLGKTHALHGHAVQSRRQDFLLTVTTQVAITQVVRENENDVWETFSFSASGEPSAE
ncbi:MAG: hypothetical protein BWY09_02077 [Candidatus Hydrogenedentes bacterium ADurb.Bin179]|nr:MAG: hypothetical protein BWY09_02077 [Candidatus Hydrogenedentes bacterium ADurb.Bin179]